MYNFSWGTGISLVKCNFLTFGFYLKYFSVTKGHQGCVIFGRKSFRKVEVQVFTSGVLYRSKSSLINLFLGDGKIYVKLKTLFWRQCHGKLIEFLTNNQIDLAKIHVSRIHNLVFQSIFSWNWLQFVKNVDFKSIWLLWLTIQSIFREIGAKMTP